MMWRPIETAPRDELLDLWQENRRYADCYYDQICDHWRTSRPGGKLFVGIKPSHWMYPPKPPNEPDPTTTLLARMAEALSKAANALEAIAEMTWDKRDPCASRIACDEASSLANTECEDARKALAEYAAMTGENGDG